MHSRRNAAFTLLELAIVVLVLSLLAAAAFRYSTNITNTNNTIALNKTMDAIEAALRNYRNTYSLLPCPSDITLAENASTFGTQTDLLADGSCTGYTTGFINSGTDPDNADPNFSGGAPSYIIQGGVPTKTLKIDDKYAYDPWGRRIMFVVDKRITATGAFTTYTVSNTTIGGIVVKKNSTDTLANAITTKGIYALVSFGPNGHGGYARNPSATAVRFNAGSTNTNELKNCHCTSAAVASTFDRIFVQALKTPSTTLTNIFDDIVRVRTRAQMISYSELQ